ncbi:MAG: hypothetical protein ACI8TQ_001246 [Planctomycetota bacterium]|jgi:hypothetical protein
MDPLIYSVIHVASAILLTAFTFKAFAAPSPEKRKGTMMMTGILTLLLFVAGFGLLAKLKIGFDGWVIVKIVCALVMAALSGIAYRKPGATGVLTSIAVIVVGVALYMVYFRPF